MPSSKKFYVSRVKMTIIENIPTSNDPNNYETHTFGWLPFNEAIDEIKKIGQYSISNFCVSVKFHNGQLNNLTLIQAKKIIETYTENE